MLLITFMVTAFFLLFLVFLRYRREYIRQTTLNIFGEFRNQLVIALARDEVSSESALFKILYQTTSAIIRRYDRTSFSLLHVLWRMWLLLMDIKGQERHERIKEICISAKDGEEKLLEGFRQTVRKAYWLNNPVSYPLLYGSFYVFLGILIVIYVPCRYMALLFGNTVKQDEEVNVREHLTDIHGREVIYYFSSELKATA